MSAGNVPVKKIVQCPECETDVNLAETSECQKCGLNVGRVMERHRLDKALQKIREREEKDAAKDKKEKEKKDNPWW